MNARDGAFAVADRLAAGQHQPEANERPAKRRRFRQEKDLIAVQISAVLRGEAVEVGRVGHESEDGHYPARDRQTVHVDTISVLAPNVSSLGHYFFLA